MKVFHGFLWVAFLGGQAMAEVQWWELSSPYSYEDVDTNCTEHLPTSGERVYLAAKVKDGVATQAELRSAPRPHSKRHLLTPTELASLKLFEDYYGNYWIENLDLNSASVVWSINRFGSYFCRPTQALVSVETKGLNLSFDTTNLGLEYLVAVAAPTQLRGNRKDGKPFKLEFQFEQRRHQ